DPRSKRAWMPEACGGLPAGGRSSPQAVRRRGAARRRAARTRCIAPSLVDAGTGVAAYPKKRGQQDEWKASVLSGQNALPDRQGRLSHQLPERTSERKRLRALVDVGS